MFCSHDCAAFSNLVKVECESEKIVSWWWRKNGGRGSAERGLSSPILLRKNCKRESFEPHPI
jgi:hypothetical protein